ncbi:hypothetical protein AMTR_s00135p00099480 [Amborella trichopoda]|uniref:Uncharacterized protein n=1 Tax=Amborella trichopoda TaxID=13333 RepID=W1P7I5_AMBTC|nr:hypothetical protein AMTR_s00135p00099480 [Amborella trichopoda]
MGTTNTISNNPNPIKGYILLAINGLFLILGGATVPPLLRLYFIHALISFHIPLGPPKPGIGLLIGLDNYMYAFGLSYLTGSGLGAEVVSGAKYALGYVLSVGTAAVFGLVVPLLELMYSKAKVVVTYTLVLEMQVIMYVVATAFCTVGMIVNKNFQVSSISPRI